MCFPRDFIRRGLFPRGLRAKSSTVPSGAEGKQADEKVWKLKKSDAPTREVFERSREASGAEGLETQPKPPLPTNTKSVC